AMPVARYGDETQRTQWAQPAIAGDVILAAALQEHGNHDLTHPITTTDMGIGGWQIDGAKYCVPAAHLATRLLVPARTGVGVGVFLVDPHRDGVTLTRATQTSGEPLFHVSLSGARGEAVGDPAA